MSWIFIGVILIQMLNKNDGWFYEEINGLRLGFLVEDILYHEHSSYQEIYVLKFKNLGKALILDQCVQLTERDEYVYHELIVHPALFTHPCPQRVLVIGGGDGGSVREILKHEMVQELDLVEIDAEVIKVAQRYFPSVSNKLRDKRVKIHISDGRWYVKKNRSKYDIVIIDSTDPVGPAKVLYEKGFQEDLVEVLNEDGIMVIQSESPYLHEQFIKGLCDFLKDIYPIVRIYVYAIPSYPGGMWSFILGSFKYDPVMADEALIEARWRKMHTKYYNPKVHKGGFLSVPQFMLKEKESE
ncbi:spermidine synthase [Candidatus Desulfofervidus auxilii]|uniref:Polyamine aminopropyltransferase n=2 Tax=Desulfofervidus auxilii TaxID=1621989 RepID=A0A7U4QJE5_DESA2|nr:spermidine synthase [Candidatus Desulfofervidus auxilii]